MAGDRLDAALGAELEALEKLGRRRTLAAPRNFERAYDFTSNDYLGLASDPRVLAAGRAALDTHGAGGRAARLLGGGAGQVELEAAAAAWLGAEAALLFPSGYQANLGVLTALSNSSDVLFSDELNHASLIDGMRLTSARRAVFPHKDLAALEEALERSMDARRRLIVTESVFSMDGDAADLEALDALAKKYDAWLIIDEAHAVGLVGQHGAGLGAKLARDPESRILARTITGGKALGCGGALIAGSQNLIELIANRARSFIFTTAPTPALTASLAAAIAVLASEDDPGRVAREAAAQLAELLQLPRPAAAIVPVPIPAAAGEDERVAVATAEALAEAGFDVRAVRPPTVPAGTSRLRIVCHAWQGRSEVEALAAAIRKAVPAPSMEAAESEPKAQAAPSAFSAPANAPVAQPKSPVLFIAGTDTDVGKTVVSALICRALQDTGSVHYWKPVQTGDDSDSNTVEALAGLAPHQVQRPAWQLELPASPHAAAEAGGVRIDPTRIFGGLGALRRMLNPAPLVVELAGGLLVPYTSPGETKPTTQLDWLAEERPPFVLVARSGLGTLNHTMLSLAALKAKHLRPVALFLVGPRHASNRETLRAWTGLPIHELPELTPLTPAALDHWLEGEPLEWLPRAPCEPPEDRAQLQR